MEILNKQTIEIEAGRTLQSYVDELPEQLHSHLELYINGNHIDEHEWNNITTIDGDSILFGIRPKGGSSSAKRVIGAIAAIAVAIVAPVLAGTILGTTSGFGYYALAAGLTLVGTMAINALIPPPTVSAPQASSGPMIDSGGSPSYEQSNAYSIEGQSNSARPYKTVAKVYGRHKVFPAIASTPFIHNTGICSYISDTL